MLRMDNNEMDMDHQFGSFIELTGQRKDGNFKRALLEKRTYSLVQVDGVFTGNNVLQSHFVEDVRK